ncbi:MAG: hypothetical protein ACRDJS_08550 [Actinomycetota bacterium]
MRPIAPEMTYPDLEPPGGIAPTVRVTAEQVRRMKRAPSATRAEGRESKQSAVELLRARLTGRTARLWPGR